MMMIMRMMVIDDDDDDDDGVVELTLNVFFPGTADINFLLKALVSEMTTSWFQRTLAQS